jgi:hypothetical protein
MCFQGHRWRTLDQPEPWEDQQHGVLQYQSWGRFPGVQWKPSTEITGLTEKFTVTGGTWDRDTHWLRVTG